MAFSITRGARSKCPICGKQLAESEIAIVEETYYTVGDDDERVRRKYCHLDCAVEVKRQYAYNALIARDAPAALVEEALVEVARTDAKLADEVRTLRTEQYARIEKRAVPLDDDAQTEALIAQLEASPDDRGLYAVLADHLQQRGDERGELIVLDLAAAPDPVASARRRTLSTALAPDLLSHLRTWGFGFLKTVELRGVVSLANHAAVLQHPSCRLLQTLFATSARGRGDIPIDVALIPRSLRNLRLVLDHAPLDLARLPYLGVVATPHVIAHPTLPELALLGPTLETVEACATSLPAVTRLKITNQPKRCVEVLSTSGWLSRLTTLDIGLDTHGVKLLEQAFAKRKLARLAVNAGRLGAASRPRLQALCETLVFNPPRERPTGPPMIEHANKPEWGRGTILKEYDGKIDVEFPTAGKKTFKADAAFLVRLGRE